MGRYDRGYVAGVMVFEFEMRRKLLEPDGMFRDRLTGLLECGLVICGRRFPGTYMRAPLKGRRTCRTRRYHLNEWRGRPMTSAARDIG